MLVSNSPAISRSLIAACAVWPLLFVWQGLDVTDMGYWLSGYQQFYSSPGETGTLLFWLSCFFGHWAGFVSGDTVIGYKLAYVVVSAGTAWLTWCAIGRVFGFRPRVAAFVLLTMMFAGRSTENWVDYNNLTGLFYVAGAGLLSLGLVRGRRPLVLLSGAVLTANVFIRLPNILGLSLGVGILLWAWGNHWSVRELTVTGLAFASGILIGAIVVVTMIELHGHRQEWLSEVRHLFVAAAGEESLYSRQNLLRILARDYLRCALVAVPATLFGAWIAYLLRGVRGIVLAPVLTCVVVIMVSASRGRGELVTIAATGFMYIVLSVTVASEARRSPDLALLAFLAGTVLFVTPLGSSNGMQNAVFGMHLALPVALLSLWDRRFLVLRSEPETGRARRILVVTISLSILIHSLTTAWRFTYRDSVERSLLTASLTHPKLILTWTHQSRAQSIGELCTALQQVVSPDDKIIACGSISLVHFLTRTRPWLRTAWPELLRPEELARRLEQGEDDGNCRPVIVRARVDTHLREWPRDAPLTQSDSLDCKNRAVIQSFVDRLGYALVWQNEAFEILLAP